jgi:hypothetical protein
MPSEGSMNVTIPAAGATYTLQAFNACGTASMTLPVLPLNNAGTLSVTPAAAKPGQPITINFGQQDLTGIAGVQFVVNGVLQYVAAIDSIDDSGNVTLTVPTISDPSKPNSILSGAAVLLPNMPDNTGVKGPSFTLQPLTYTGNAITEFRQLIAYLAAESHANFKTVSGVYSGSASDLAAGGALIDQYLQVLNKIADDLSARGTATVPVDLPTPTYPIPDTVTITTADLQDYLAYLHVATGTDQLIPSTSVRPQPRFDTKEGPCVRDTDPFYAACLLMSTSVLDGAVKTGADQFWNFAKDVMAKWLSKVIDAAQMACYLAPLVPQSFRVGPSDFVLPGKTDDKQMIGQLGPYWTKQGLIDAIVAGAEKGFQQEHDTDILKGVPKATADKRQADGIAAAKKQAQSMADAAARIAAGITAERVFGRCELTDAAVAVKFRRNLERIYAGSDPRLYRYKGKAKGDGNLDIYIDPTEFVNFHRPAEGQHRLDSQTPFQATISVGQPKRTLRIDKFYAQTSPSQQFPLPGLPITLRDGQGFKNTITIFGNKYLLNIKSLKPGVWRVDLTITRGDTATPGTPRGVLAFSSQREAADNGAQEIELDLSSSGNAPTNGSLVPSDSNVTISASAEVNARGNSTSLSVTAQNGASIKQQANKLFGIGATTSTVMVIIDAKGYSPNITFSTIIKMEDVPQ